MKIASGATARSTAATSCVEPSSTTMISTFAGACRRALSSASGSRWACW
jgi:hypothetical protein